MPHDLSPVVPLPEPTDNELTWLREAGVAERVTTIGKPRFTFIEPVSGLVEGPPPSIEAPGRPVPDIAKGDWPS